MDRSALIAALIAPGLWLMFVGALAMVWSLRLLHAAPARARVLTILGFCLAQGGLLLNAALDYQEEKHRLGEVLRLLARSGDETALSLVPGMLDSLGGWRLIIGGVLLGLCLGLLVTSLRGLRTDTPARVAAEETV